MGELWECFRLGFLAKLGGIYGEKEMEWVQLYYKSEMYKGVF